MRIGIDITPLIQEYYSGVQFQIQHQVEALVERFDHDQFVLTGLIPRAAETRMRSWPIWSTNNVTWALRPLPARMFHFLGDHWQRVGWPPVEMMTGKLDVYHTFDWFTFNSRAVQSATVYDLTPLLFPHWHTEVNQQVFKRRIQAVTARATVVMAISQATKNDLKRYFPQFKGQVEVIYPDCSATFRAVNKGSDQAILKQHGIHSGYYLAVGTIEPRKNLRRVVEAYRKLPPLVSQKRQLIIIGARGWEAESVWNKLMKTAGVRWLDYIPNEQLPTFYRQARALLFPSLYEGFGIPVLEALRCGCLVLTSPVSSLPEVGGEAVFYCDPQDPTDILRQMKTIDTLDKVEIEKRRKLGFEQARRFSYATSAEQMMGIWRSLMR